MTPIEIVYKTMYNYFVKRDGYKVNSHTIAGAPTFLCNICFLLSFYCIINLIVNRSISISIGKVPGLMIIGLLMVSNHYLLFGILKFSKNGDSANCFFSIDKRTYSLGWRIFIFNLLLAVILPILDKLLLT